MEHSEEVANLCFGCLLEGTISHASSTRLGLAVCQRHASENSGPVARRTTCSLCESAGKAHWAWTIRSGQPVCIFHAIDNLFPNDDMREHDLYTLVYEQLRKAGYPDAY